MNPDWITTSEQLPNTYCDVLGYAVDGARVLCSVVIEFPEECITWNGERSEWFVENRLQKCWRIECDEGEYLQNTLLPLGYFTHWHKVTTYHPSFDKPKEPLPQEGE